jgi:glyoxylase-like metal-dependent hydrolase (beta-lactamase superfamily II)
MLTGEGGNMSLSVFHMGDVFFNGLYPFIDVSSGGSIDGIIAAVERVLNYSRLNDETRFIPGHGPLAGPDELRTYLDVLRTVRERIQSLIDDGMSEDQVVAANPTREYDAEWGGGFMNPETFTRLVYQSLEP